MVPLESYQTLAHSNISQTLESVQNVSDTRTILRASPLLRRYGNLGTGIQSLQDATDTSSCRTDLRQRAEHLELLPRGRRSEEAARPRLKRLKAGEPFVKSPVPLSDSII